MMSPSDKLMSPISSVLNRGNKRGLFAALLGGRSDALPAGGVGAPAAPASFAEEARAVGHDAGGSRPAAAAVASPEPRSLFQRMALRQTFLQSGGGGASSSKAGSLASQVEPPCDAAASMTHNVFAPSELFAPPEMANCFYSPTLGEAAAGGTRARLTEGL